MALDYENPWLYQGTAFTSDDIDGKFGFVYRITNLQTEKAYIGRKYFYAFRTPKGKKRKVKQESDWKKYYGSCPELKEDKYYVGESSDIERRIWAHKNDNGSAWTKKYEVEERMNLIDIQNNYHELIFLYLSS